MRVLIIGNGGREHAIAWKVAQSPQVKHIWVAPGNAGTAQEPKTQNIPIHPTDLKALLTFAQQKTIDLTIVGPEASLAEGIVDVFQHEGLAVFGPTKKSAELETSKAFCKAFLNRYRIPTARYATFTNKTDALNYLEKQSIPVVIKASGLASGKGVVIAQTKEKAETAIINMLEKKQFGDAGREIVIEEFLEGEELSFIVLLDGKNVLPLASAQDHKRRDDGDHGPNTGGMGAYSPVPRMTTALHEKIMEQVIEPTVAGLYKENLSYTGFLYAGLMITNHNEPKVLEFNVRLGDPETQPLMMRLRSDLVSLIQAALRGDLDRVTVDWDPRAALAVVLASKGYPDDYRRGEIITGLDQIHDPDVKVFHAGTQQRDQHIVTDGGRVLAVTALGPTLKDAQTKSYTAIQSIHWPSRYYRRDIGNRALLR